MPREASYSEYAGALLHHMANHRCSITMLGDASGRTSTHGLDEVSQRMLAEQNRKLQLAVKEIEDNKVQLNNMRTK